MTSVGNLEIGVPERVRQDVEALLNERGLKTIPFASDVRIGDRLIANDPRRKVRELVVCALHGAVVKQSGEPTGGPHERVSAAPTATALYFMVPGHAVVPTAKIYADGKTRRDGFSLVRASRVERPA